MSKGKTGKETAPTQPDKQSSGVGVWLAYGLIVVLAVAAYAIYSYRQHVARVEEIKEIQAEALHAEQVAKANAARGLPDTYPADFMPLYPGVELLNATAEDATADDGTPMDKWHVLSQTDSPKQAVYDFYMQRLDAEDMRQTMYISLPTGYSVSYADENRIVELRIEKLSADPKLQVEITVYVVKGQPASKAPYDASAAPPPAADSPAAPVEEEPGAPGPDEPTSDPPK